MLCPGGWHGPSVPKCRSSPYNGGGGPHQILRGARPWGMYHIKRIKLSGFRSIGQIRYRARKDAEPTGLPLRDLNILIGAIGSGKSNFLSFFKLLREFVESDKEGPDAERERADRFRLYVAVSGGATRLMYFGPKVTDEISAEIWLAENEDPPIAAGLSYRFTLLPTQDG